MKVVNAAARLLARARQRSVPIADTYDIRPDPDAGAFGIAAMRVVGEEIIQAVGYGLVSQAPQIVVEHHALSRRTNFLIPFAVELDRYLTNAIDAGFPRIYLPNSATLELLTIMAARYENAARNPNPNPALRPDPRVIRLGYLCRLLKDIYHIPGQQLVVVMPETIARHFVSGQVPPKDGHLGALTAWLAAPIDATGTQALADERALAHPAAAMLSRESDESIESRLHRIRKSKSPDEQLRHQRAIEDLQRRAITTEWLMLQDARTALWNRSLKQSRHDELTSKNVSWLRYRLGTVVPRARRAIAMSQRYELHEYHAGVHQAELIAQDALRFEHERANGKAFIATISAVSRTPRGTNPKDHRIELVIEYQPKIRLRIGHNVQIIGTHINGKVRSFARTVDGYVASLQITDGIRAVQPGGPHRWADRVAKDPFINNKYYDRIRAVLDLA